MPPSPYWQAYYQHHGNVGSLYRLLAPGGEYDQYLVVAAASAP
jgi:hypothetical protein